MKLNPIFNAVVAALYICAIALFMRYIESVRGNTPDTLIDGMGFLSLFVLSVATMAFLFFYQPAALLLDHKPKEATAYFLKTLGVFAVMTVAFLTLAGVQ